MATQPIGNQRLSAKQTAARLGVKVETLYAYVSRGMLQSRREPGQRASTFDPAEVERLASHKRGRPRMGSLQVVIDTQLTLMEQEGVSYRGLKAGDLARNRSFESVAEWLWNGAFDPDPSAWHPEPAAFEVVRGLQPLLPDAAVPTDRMRAIVPVVAALDPLRFDLDPAVLTAVGRSLIATLVDGLPTLGEPARARLAIGESPAREDPLAARLWPRLSPEPAPPGALELLNAALVMGADHELAASTLATRVAASVRADPYSIVSTGLGVLAGPLHGAASGQAHRLLREVERPERARAVVAEHIRRERIVHGFGHLFYEREDPRAVVLLELLRASDVDPVRLAAVETVLELLNARLPVFMNVDFALASLAFCSGMCPGAPEAIFAVARCAGWLAHAIEEFDQRPVRFRPRANYLGPTPASE
jgi:citrate synthase